MSSGAGVPRLGPRPARGPGAAAHHGAARPHDRPRARLGDHRPCRRAQRRARARRLLHQRLELGGARRAAQVRGAPRPAVHHQAAQQDQARKGARSHDVREE